MANRMDKNQIRFINFQFIRNFNFSLKASRKIPHHFLTIYKISSTSLNECVAD